MHPQQLLLLSLIVGKERNRTSTNESDPPTLPTTVADAQVSIGFWRSAHRYSLEIGNGSQESGLVVLHVPCRCSMLPRCETGGCGPRRCCPPLHGSSRSRGPWRLVPWWAAHACVRWLAAVYAHVVGWEGEKGGRATGGGSGIGEHLPAISEPVAAVAQSPQLREHRPCPTPSHHRPTSHCIILEGDSSTREAGNLIAQEQGTRLGTHRLLRHGVVCEDAARCQPGDGRLGGAPRAAAA